MYLIRDSLRESVGFPSGICGIQFVYVYEEWKMFSHWVGDIRGRGCESGTRLLWVSWNRELDSCVKVVFVSCVTMRRGWRVWLSICLDWNRVDQLVSAASTWKERDHLLGRGPPGTAVVLHVMKENKASKRTSVHYSGTSLQSMHSQFQCRTETFHQLCMHRATLTQISYLFNCFHTDYNLGNISLSNVGSYIHDTLMRNVSMHSEQGINLPSRK